MSPRAVAQDCTPVDEVAAATPTLSTLAGLATAAGVAEPLSDPAAQLTVFAPTNAAFEAAGAIDELADAPFALASVRRRPSASMLSSDR